MTNPTPEELKTAFLPRIRDELEAIRLEHIQPGKPPQNAYIERYKRTVRGE